MNERLRLFFSSLPPSPSLFPGEITPFLIVGQRAAFPSPTSPIIRVSKDELWRGISSNYYIRGWVIKWAREGRRGGGGKVFVKPGLKMERNPAAIGRRRFEGDAVSPPLFSPPLASSPPPLLGWPGVILETGFPEQRNFFSVRNYYREFHGRMFVSRISFPLHRPVGHSTRVHSYSSVFQLLSESSSGLYLTLSLSLFFERDSSFRFRIHRPSKRRRASGAIEWKKLYPRKSPSFYRILRNASLFLIVSSLFFQTTQTFRDTLRSELCTVKSIKSVTRYFKHVILQL